MKYVDLLDAVKYKIEDDDKLYHLQKQTVLKLLALIELILDNNWEGEIKINNDWYIVNKEESVDEYITRNKKTLLHIEEN
jgi:hypothetical protein